MKTNKSIFSAILLAIVALFTSANSSAAEPSYTEAMDSAKTFISGVSASDKVYLSATPLAVDNGSEQMQMHYSHGSHRSHGSHQSHRSHYSSSY